MQNGYLELGEWNGVLVRAHWTALPTCIVFTGFRFTPAAWLAFAFLILVHEFGHAMVIRASRATVVGIDLTGYGGECHWKGSVHPLARALIAWGGVMAQLVLLGVTCAVLPFLPSIAPDAAKDAVFVLTLTNVFLVVMNLMPIPPLDGAQAWRVVPIAARSLGSRLRTLLRMIALRITTRCLDRSERNVGPMDPGVDAQLKDILARSGKRDSEPPRRGT